MGRVTRRGSIGYVPALDGLRALAVASVIAFHFGIAGVPGGFLGVDIFFVLSGYLITSLLVAEWSATGGISLRSFWGRRARRLFPALFVTLVGVSLAAAFLDDPSQLASLRSDALATLLYVANWHYIAASQNYFAHFGIPSPLLHTWSLAVEEQFYLVWPLIAVAAVHLGRRMPKLSAGRLLLVLAVAGSIASAVWMAVSYGSGADPSRQYFGTDTHAQVILVGAALALFRPGPSWVATRARRLLISSAAAAGALFTAWEVHAVLGRVPLSPSSGLGGRIAWFFDGVLGSQDFLYRGGFLAVSVAVAAVIAFTVAWGASAPSRLLAAPPLRYIGRISYGLYLYHWPAFSFVTPATTGMRGGALLALRLGVTFVAAVASFHLLETPIRQGLSGRLSGRMQLAGLLPASVACVVAAVLVGTSLPASASGGRLPPTTAPIPTTAGTHPVHVLLVGDSVALTLGIGLSLDSAAYGVTIDDQGELGCSIAQTNPIEVSGSVGDLPPCNPLTGQTWQQFWPSLLTRDRPDVVAVLFGRWEVVDRNLKGRWVHVGMPDYDAYLTSQLTEAVEILDSKGAKVALLTAPYYDEPPAPDGSPYPENDPSRVDAWNRIVRSVAASVDARRPGTVSVIDLGAMLDPHGHYSTEVDGVAVRCPDGVHLSYQAGELLRPVLLPELASLGYAAWTKAPPGSSLSPVSPEPSRPTTTSPSALRAQVPRNVPLDQPYCPYGPQLARRLSSQQ